MSESKVPLKADPEAFAEAHLNSLKPRLLDKCVELEKTLKQMDSLLLGDDSVEAIIHIGRDEEGNLFDVAFRKDADGDFSCQYISEDVTEDDEDSTIRFSLERPETDSYPALGYRNGELFWGDGLPCSENAKNTAAVYFLSETDWQLEQLEGMAELLSDSDLNPAYSNRAAEFAEIARHLGEEN